MDYSKLIDLYLEGELSSVEQDLLFAELSKNPELRELFDSEIKLHLFVQKDYSQITPPVESTNYIFSAANFKIPNSGYSPGSSGGKFIAAFNNAKQFIGKNLSYIVSSVVGSALTFFLLWLLLPFGTTERNIATTQQFEPTPYIYAGESQAIPIESQRETQPGISKEAIDRLIQNAFENALNKYLAENVNQIAKSTGKPNNQDLLTLSETRLENNYVLQRETKFPELRTTNNGDLYFLNQSSDLTGFLSKNLGRLSLTARGFSMKATPDVKLNQSENTILNNSAIGLSYYITDNTAIGLEIGQEKFPQSFTLTAYGETKYQKQNPLLLWYGLVFRQSIPELFKIESIRPFAQLFLGTTTVGPLARGTIGLQYSPDRRVSLILGWESSYLLYKVQNTYYNTQKNGLTYGVSIRY
jgi:hypothetical protein